MLILKIKQKLFKCIPVELYGIGADIPLTGQEIGKIACEYFGKISLLHDCIFGINQGQVSSTLAIISGYKSAVNRR